MITRCQALRTISLLAAICCCSWPKPLQPNSQISQLLQLHKLLIMLCCITVYTASQLLLLLLLLVVSVLNTFCCAVMPSTITAAAYPQWTSCKRPSSCH
jgi:hypothetical protein